MSRSVVEHGIQERAWWLLAQAQDGDPELRRIALAGVGPLLTEGRAAALDPAGYARLLRVAVLVRELADDPAHPVDPLLNELLDHAGSHELIDFTAAAHALRGQIALGAGRPDAALGSVASALVALDDSPSSYERGLALSDVGILLVHLGLEDFAEPLLAEAHSDIGAYGRPRQLLISISNRVHATVVRVLARERATAHQPAADRYREAAGWASSGLQDWAEIAARSNGEMLGEEYAGELHAAVALHAVAAAGPDDPREVAAGARRALQSVLPRLNRTDRKLVAGIALSRLHHRLGDAAAALGVLRSVASAAPDREVERQLQ
ncbi:MAG TPA: hypothetical protein VHH34_07920, partial [Pseudonocardiaceae bacterium]|nr:hypothetical protein [Pseudonocardiaceae bacterium]